MVRPPLLKQGDTIAIAAPGRKVSKSEMVEAISVFESWGLRVKLSPNLFSEKHSYLAGTDDERLNDLQMLIDDENVNAIIAARGGYGSTRMLDKLDFNSLRKKPKWLIGFSDITAIHLRLLSYQLQCIHATMPILFGRNNTSDSIESLRRLLFDGSFILNAEGSSDNRPGSSNGILIGGNLSLIVDSLGTESEIQTEGTILFIEEIDEYFYRIDRMMTHLKRAGKLAKLKGLAIGYFTDLKESELPFNESYHTIILNAIKEYNYPVAFGFPSGHDNPNLAWVQGQVVTFESTLHGKSAITPLQKFSANSVKSA